MQATLLVICLFWQARQRRLGIDDFGNAILSDVLSQGNPSSVTITLGPETEVSVSEEQSAEIVIPADSAQEVTPLLTVKDDNAGSRRTWLPRLF